MKLASLKAGGRDGALVVVDRALTHCLPMPEVAPTLQAALEDWDRYAAGADWRGLAWWIHDHLPYAHLQFFPKLAAFNIQWHERPARRSDSFIAPRGCLTNTKSR